MISWFKIREWRCIWSWWRWRFIWFWLYLVYIYFLVSTISTSLVYIYLLRFVSQFFRFVAWPGSAPCFVLTVRPKCFVFIVWSSLYWFIISLDQVLLSWHQTGKTKPEGEEGYHPQWEHGGNCRNTFQKVEGKLGSPFGHIIIQCYLNIQFHRDVIDSIRNLSQLNSSQLRSN